MAQAGHADPKMTLGIYAQVIASKTDHGAALDDQVGDSLTGVQPIRTPDKSGIERNRT